MAGVELPLHSMEHSFHNILGFPVFASSEYNSCTSSVGSWAWLVCWLLEGDSPLLRKVIFFHFCSGIEKSMSANFAKGKA